MSNESHPDTTPQGRAADRREFIRRFGLTAAGLTLGSYIAPAMASFRPPAALVGSTDVAFWEEARRPFACDGPAADKPAGYTYSVKSLGFEGVVAIVVVPTTATSGWNISLDRSRFLMKPGDQFFPRLMLDCYSDPQVGATPRKVSVRVTAVAHPANGDREYVIGTHVAVAESVLSTLRFAAPAQTLVIDAPGHASGIVTVQGEWIDSAKFGSVRLMTEGVPRGWQVILPQPELFFAGSAALTAPIAVRVPPRTGNLPGQFRLVATLAHPSFSAPMTTTMVINVTA